MNTCTSRYIGSQRQKSCQSSYNPRTWLRKSCDQSRSNLDAIEVESNPDTRWRRWWLFSFSSSNDDDGSDQSTPRRGPRRMHQHELQQQLEMLLNDQRQTAHGRRITGISTTNTFTTAYKDGRRHSVTRNWTSVRT